MAISFDKVFGLHEQGLLLRAKKAEVIASNIANADTPGYKAKGMDFQQAMQQAAKIQQTGVARTNDKHLNTNISNSSELKYRVTDQPDTGDGNTVDLQMERNLYLQNSLEYQAGIQFLNGKIKGLKKAITGAQS
ncbi:MAG: flagellar basal body rod protein FlgB [Thalassotalea sp.]